MRASAVAVVLWLTASSVFGVSRITFERVLLPLYDLGKTEYIFIISAIGDNENIEAFIEQFVDQTNRSGVLHMSDVRRIRESFLPGPNSALLSVNAFTCETRTGEGEGSAYDYEGKRVKRKQLWVDATCTARIQVEGVKQPFKFAVKGEGTSPRVDVVTDDERDIALATATRQAAKVAAERITPRRVRESIELDETAPSFAEGMARIDAQQFQEARDIWERALKKDPRDAALHYDLAAIYEALGDRAAAEQHYRAARELAPDRKEYASELRMFVRRSGRP